SGRFYFQVNAIVTPSITTVNPPAPTATGAAQPFTSSEDSRVGGCNVTLRTSGGGVYPNRPQSSFSSTSITINPNFGTITDTWSVEVINPNGASSGLFNFQVNAIVTPSITSVNPPAPTATGAAQPFT